MTNELQKSEQDLINELNQKTNFGSKNPMPPMLRYNASEGVWYKETKEKDAEGKPVFEKIGESIELNVVNTYKMLSGAFDPKTDEKYPYYTREFINDWIEVFNQNKEVVFKGTYKQLKENQNLYDCLIFNQVLYAFYGDEFYRVKLSGSKLVNWFPFLNTFANDNIARWSIKLSKGEQKQKGAVKYYDLLFSQVCTLPNEIVLKRVNDVNSYIEAYRNSVASEQPQIAPQIANNTTPAMLNQPPMPDDNQYVDVSSINF